MKLEDQVLLKSPKSDQPPYVGSVHKLKSNYKVSGIFEVKARVKWYYKPEDTSKGRKDYHGSCSCLITMQLKVLIALSERVVCTSLGIM